MASIKNKVKDICKFEFGLKIFLVILFCVMVSGLTVIIYMHNFQLHAIAFGKEVDFNDESREIVLSRVENGKKNQILQGWLGLNLPGGLLPLDCSEKEDPKDSTCLLWKNYAYLRVTLEENNEVGCYEFSWTPIQQYYFPKDCFKVGSVDWYGGFSDLRTSVQAKSFSAMPFVTGTLNSQGVFGSVIHPYWLLSSGVSIYLSSSDELPLSVSLNRTINGNEEYFCIESRYINSPYKNYNGKLPELNYSLCLDSNVTNLHLHSINASAQAPLTPPPSDFFTKSLLSTWAKYKSGISEDGLIDFADRATLDGILPGIFLVGNGWQEHYGDFIFNSTKFPNDSRIVGYLKDLGNTVSLETSPICDIESTSFLHGAQQDYFVIDAGDAAPGLLQFWKGLQSEKWYRGYASSIDMHSDGQQWFRTTLTDFLQQSGADGFAFDGGETDRTPYYGHFHDRYLSPNSYITQLNTLYSGISTWAGVRSAYKSQHLPLFVMLTEFNSTWSRVDNGIQAVIPTVLSLGIMGYPFIIPDAAGGNNYSTLNAATLTKELYIRWLQLNAFLPVLHFSILPSEFDAETVSIAKQFISLHKGYVATKLEAVLEQAATKLVPLIRPIWWLNPSDKGSYGIDDQFLLGDTVMVAPVLTAGVTSRSIYFPPGEWRDKTASNCFVGPASVNYSVSLQKIPYFEKDCPAKSAGFR